LLIEHLGNISRTMNLRRVGPTSGRIATGSASSPSVPPASGPSPTPSREALLADSAGSSAAGSAPSPVVQPVSRPSTTSSDNRSVSSQPSSTGTDGKPHLFSASAPHVILFAHPSVCASVSPTVRMSNVLRTSKTCCHCESIDVIWYCESCGRIDLRPILKTATKAWRGVVDVETLKHEAKLSQLIEIICLQTDHPLLADYREQAKTLATKLGRSKDLDKAIRDQTTLECIHKTSGNDRYTHLVDQVTEQLGGLRIGES